MKTYISIDKRSKKSPERILLQSKKLLGEFKPCHTNYAKREGLQSEKENSRIQKSDGRQRA